MLPKSPYEQIYCKKPDISHLRSFGCIGFAYLPLEIRASKLSPSAIKCRLIGYADDDDTEEIKGYKLIQETNPSIVFYSSDVRFDETLPMTPLSGLDSFDPYDTSIFTDADYLNDIREEDHSHNTPSTSHVSPPTPLTTIQPSHVSPPTPLTTIQPSRPSRHARASYASVV